MLTSSSSYSNNIKVMMAIDITVTKYNNTIVIEMIMLNYIQIQLKTPFRWPVFFFYLLGFTRQTFVTFYFSLSTVEYFRIFTFYIIFDEMFLN